MLRIDTTIVNFLPGLVAPWCRWSCTELGQQTTSVIYFQSFIYSSYMILHISRCCNILGDILLVITSCSTFVITAYRNFNWHQSRHLVLFMGELQGRFSSNMEREGGQVNKPPILDGSNYDYWKVRVTTFLKSIDNKTWKAVLKGWEHPRVKDKDGNDTSDLKRKMILLISMKLVTLECAGSCWLQIRKWPTFLELEFWRMVSLFLTIYIPLCGVVWSWNSLFLVLIPLG